MKRSKFLLLLLLSAAIHCTAAAQDALITIGDKGRPVSGLEETGRILRSRANVEVTPQGYIKATVKFADGTPVRETPITFTIFNGQEKEFARAICSDQQGAVGFQIQPDSLKSRTVRITVSYFDSQSFKKTDRDLCDVILDEQCKITEIRHGAAKRTKSDRKKRSGK